MSAARYLPFVGRLLIGLPFLMSGVGKIMTYGATTAYIKSSALPLPASFAYVGAVAVEVGCGLFIIGGYRTRVVAAILALFCLTTAVFFHTHISDPNQTFHFIKNLVMAGGLLQIVSFGAGAFSIDGRRSNDGVPAAVPQGANRVEHKAHLQHRAKLTEDPESPREIVHENVLVLFPLALSFVFLLFGLVIAFSA